MELALHPRYIHWNVKASSSLPLLRLSWLPLALFLFLIPMSSAQTSPPSNKASCKIDLASPTETELAFYRGDFSKAVELAAAAYKSNPADRRSRQLEIDSLLGQRKLDEARKNTDAWTSVEPTEPLAIVTAGELRHAEGDWLESYALMLKALKIDPCLPAAYEGLAEFESLAGYHAAAQKHLTLAHQLQPNNENIRLAWIGSLNPEQSIAEFTSLVQKSKSLDEKRRATLGARLGREQSRLKDRCELSMATTLESIPTDLKWPSTGTNESCRSTPVPAVFLSPTASTPEWACVRWTPQVYGV
jgi:tetratricopeptide (TPR) repeat protein